VSADHTAAVGPYFARKATGLVRELSAFHSLVFNASFINVGLILIYMFLFVPSFHPGSSMWIACAVGTLAAVFMALANAMLATTFPRSGGEYVYNSRAIAPFVGFATNFNITIWLLFYVGVSCVLFPKYGLTAVFRFVGVRYGNPGLLGVANWLATPTGMFIIGSAALLIVITGLVFSTRRVARIQSWYFVIGLIGIAVAVAVLMAETKQTYIGRFDSYFGTLAATNGTMAATLAGARQNGFESGGFSLLATMVVFFWPASFLFWGNASTYFGGEVRDAKRSQLFGLLGAVVLAGVLLVLVVLAFQRTVGADSLGAIGYLNAIGKGFGFAPTYAELAAIGTSSTFLGLVILLACTYWTVAFVPLCVGACTRNLLAWSLDRVAPEALSSVSPRFHTPVPALLVCGFIGWIAVALHSYVPAFAFMVGTFGAFLTFMTTAVSAILLPFRRPRIFADSPMNRRVGRLPVMSLVGVLALIGTVAIQVSLLSDKYSGISLFRSTDAGTGPGVPFKMLLVNLGILASGFVLYAVAKLVRRAQGVDVTLAFKEIPPE